MKYRILTDQTKIVDGHILHRIQRISDDALGGWIESEHNLSQEGDCWVSDEACVYSKARVSDSAAAYEDARIYGFAHVFGWAQVSGSAQVYGSARVLGSAVVYDAARVFGSARVSGDAQVYGSAQVYVSARVFDSAKVCDEAQVCGNVKLRFGKFTSDCRVDHAAVIRCGVLNATFVDGKITLYKRVNKTENPNVWTSCWDADFKYYKGRPRTVKNPNMDWEQSCASGLHLSRADYWDDGDTLIACEVELKDIICVQEGKVRCRRISKVLGAVD